MPSKKVLFCPKCKSQDIQNDLSNPAAIRFGILNIKVCGKCGYQGTFFPQTTLAELKKIKTN